MQWLLILFIFSFFSAPAEAQEHPKPIKKTCYCCINNSALYGLWFCGDPRHEFDHRNEFGNSNCGALVSPGWINNPPHREYCQSDKQYERELALYYALIPASTKNKENFKEYYNWISSKGFNLYNYTNFVINEVFARKHCNISLEWDIAYNNFYHTDLSNSHDTYIKTHEKITSAMKKSRQLFRELYAKCRREHHCLQTTYEYGLLSQHMGDYAQSAQLMSDYAQMASDLDASTPISPKAYTLACHSLLSALDYDKAIALLTEAIKKYPDRKELYEMRIAAYLELGKFNEAAQDYIAQDFDKSLASDTSKAVLSAFFLKGAALGCVDGVCEFPCSLLYSLRGTGLMLWTTVTDPLSVPATVMNSIEETIAVLRGGDGKILEQIAPELHSIVTNWDQLSPESKWEQIGHFYGKYGFDILACLGSPKLLELSQSIRLKNSLCNVRANILSAEKKVAIIAEQIATKRKAFFENSKINWGKQGKHIEGHNSWNTLDPTERKRKSILTHKDPEKLLREHAGKGSPTPNQTKPLSEVGYKENVDFKETIGIWKNEEGTDSKLTTRGRIYYNSKGEAHIVPIHPMAE